MIDVNRIRSLKTLATVTKDLNEFITNPVVKEIYLEESSEADYNDDIDAAKELLEKVKRREVSLNRLLARTGKLPPQISEKEEIPSEE